MADETQHSAGQRRQHKSGPPRIPIVESGEEQQWVPPTLACPFLDKGEASFIERFVKMEVGLAESVKAQTRVEDQVRYMRNTLIAAIITIIGSIVVSLTLANMRPVPQSAAPARVTTQSAPATTVVPPVQAKK